MSPLAHSIWLSDGIVLKQHIDHIQGNEEVEKQSPITEGVESESENWSYRMPVKYEYSVHIAIKFSTSEVPNKYPARNQQSPQRLIKQTDI